MMSFALLALLLLNILFMVALWHLDVSHNLDRVGETSTRGIFKIKPETAYRYSQYALVLTLSLLDVLFVLCLA